MSPTRTFKGHIGRASPVARQRHDGVLPRLPIPGQLHLCFQMRSHMRRIPPASIGRADGSQPCGGAEARLAQSVERKALNLVVVGSSPTVGVFVNGTSSCNSHRLSVARWRGAALQQICLPSFRSFQVLNPKPCAVDLIHPTP
jgi:hypothetical protein